MCSKSKLGLVRSCGMNRMLGLQVAKYTWKAVNKGYYVIGSPDTGGNWLIGSSLSASSPR